MNNINDRLSSEGILNELGELKSIFDIEVKDTVTSTNVLLKTEANQNSKEGRIIIASEQTAGRGRFTRRFFSPDGSGIYMSILLCPSIPAEDAVLITTAAAVAVAEAAEKLSGKSIGIKWVNDLILNNRKICGILTEASLNSEGGRLNYAVLGIGINVYSPENGFPDEIKDIAGAIFDKKENGLRNRLAAEIIKHFWSRYRALAEKKFIEDYKKRSIVIGKQVTVLKAEKAFPATVTDIDDNCRLLVKYPDGTKDILSSGEISLKL